MAEGRKLRFSANRSLTGGRLARLIPWRLEGWSLRWLVVIFVALAWWGSPYFYDLGNSGRYLTGVLKTMDPALFPNDRVAEALGGFESLFYTGLGWLMRQVQAPPESLAGVMRWLYLASRLLLVVALYGLSGRVGEASLAPAERRSHVRWWTFALLAAWAVHSKALPIGDTRLFANTLRHTEVAFLTCLLALILMPLPDKDGASIRGEGRQAARWSWAFWLLVALTVFIHALLALHFILTLLPPLLLLAWRAGKRPDRSTLAGLALVGLSLAAYYLFLAPPPLTASEARIFWQAKGDIGHISLAGVGLRRWLLFASLMFLAGAAYWRLRLRPLAAVLFGGVIGGSVLALALSAAATASQHPVLGQVQPLRMMLWVVFLAHVLVAWAAGEALATPGFRPAAGPASLLLVGYFVLAILESTWVIAFALLAAVALLATGERPRKDPVGFGNLRGRVRQGMGVIAGRAAQVSGALALALALAWASAAAYRLHQQVVDPNWDLAALWARENSDKDESFIVTYDRESFRTRAFRPAVSHDYSALAWVNPLAFADGREQAGRIAAGRQDDAWDLDYLAGLAQEWGARYLILDGPYQPDRPPLYQAGRFAILDVTAGK